MISIGVSKGRVAKEIVNALEQIGYAFEDDIKTTRKLILNSNNGNLQLVLMKGQDIPTYVDAGVIHMGIVGKDILNESNVNIYELLSLDIGKCHLAIAGFQDFDYMSKKKLTIGTKYVKSASQYFDQMNMPHDIVYLNGSVELAPLIGLADIIVDIVETGTTLLENNLVVLDKIQEISSRVIVNKIFFKSKQNKIQPILKIFEDNFSLK